MNTWSKDFGIKPYVKICVFWNVEWVKACVRSFDSLFFVLHKVDSMTTHNQRMRWQTKSEQKSLFDFVSFHNISVPFCYSFLYRYSISREKKIPSLIFLIFVFLDLNMYFFSFVILLFYLHRGNMKNNKNACHQLIKPPSK